MIGFILLGLLLLFLLVLWLVPAGTIAHEIMGLPALWYRNSQVDLSGIDHQRITYGSHPRQYLLRISPPPNAPDRKSVIIFFHGGAWRYGRPELFLSYAAYFAKRGYGVVLPSVRRQPAFRFSSMREDLSSIIEKAVEISGTAAGENHGWIMAGVSSGGHLAAHTILDPRLRSRIPILKGAFFLAAPLSLDHLRVTVIRHKLAGEPGSAEYYEADPLNWLKGDKLPHLLLVHGTHDGLVPLSSSQEFLDKALSLGHTELELVTLDRGSHLDAVSWSYEENDLSKRLESWLARVDELRNSA